MQQARDRTLPVSWCGAVPLQHDPTYSACHDAGLQALRRQVKREFHDLVTEAHQQGALPRMPITPGRCGTL